MTIKSIIASGIALLAVMSPVRAELVEERFLFEAGDTTCAQAPYAITRSPVPSNPNESCPNPPLPRNETTCLANGKGSKWTSCANTLDSEQKSIVVGSYARYRIYANPNGCNGVIASDRYFKIGRCIPDGDNFMLATCDNIKNPRVLSCTDSECKQCSLLIGDVSTGLCKTVSTGSFEVQCMNINNSPSGSGNTIPSTVLFSGLLSLTITIALMAL